MTIGVFDSGVGGLSAFRVLHQKFPQQSLLYLADQAYLPYTARTSEELRQRCGQITRYFEEQGCNLIFIACNTATAAAIDYLRATFPHLQFIGMEPAVKPAVAHTKTGVVGVMATTSTLASHRYADLVARYAAQTTLIENRCIGLAEQIDKGELDSPETIQRLREITSPMLSQHADTIILGCTHYPFVETTLRQIVGDSIAFIDPAEATVRQIGRLLPSITPQGQEKPPQFLTTADPHTLKQQINRLLNWSITDTQVSRLDL